MAKTEKVKFDNSELTNEFPSFQALEQFSLPGQFHLKSRFYLKNRFHLKNRFYLKNQFSLPVINLPEIDFSLFFNLPEID